MKQPIVIERDEVERAMHACNLLAAQRASLPRKIEGGAVVEDGSLRLDLSQLIIPVPQFVFDASNTPRRKTSIARLLDGSDVAFLRGRGYRDAACVRRNEKPWGVSEGGTHAGGARGPGGGRVSRPARARRRLEQHASTGGVGCGHA
jgi:hypothetical protein